MDHFVKNGPTGREGDTDATETFDPDPTPDPTRTGKKYAVRPHPHSDIYIYIHTPLFPSPTGHCTLRPPACIIEKRQMGIRICFSPCLRQIGSPASFCGAFFVLRPRPLSSSVVLLCKTWVAKQRKTEAKRTSECASCERPSQYGSKLRIALLKLRRFCCHELNIRVRLLWRFLRVASSAPFLFRCTSL